MHTRAREGKELGLVARDRPMAAWYYRSPMMKIEKRSKEFVSEFAIRISEFSSDDDSISRNEVSGKSVYFE